MNPRIISFWQGLSPRWRKVIARSIGLVLFYTVFGFLALPLIVKAVAVKQISKQLDRQTSIRQVRINPYALSGTIRGLLVKDKDGEPFLSLDEAYANFQLASLFGKHWVFKDIWVVKPYCRVQINRDYSFNFSDLAQKFSRPAPVPKSPAKPLLLHIGKLQVIGASASFTDLTPSEPFRRIIGPLEVTLTGLHTDPNSQNPYSFLGTTDSGEKFAWSGQFSLFPLQSAGELSLEGLSLPKYAPLFQDLVRFEVKDGIVDGRAVYRFSLTGSNYVASVTNGFCSLRSFKVTARGGTNNLVELDRFAIGGVSADTVARTAEISAIELDGGRIAAKRNRDQTINLLQLAEPADRATNAPGGVLFMLQAVTNAFAALIQSTNLWSATIHQVDLTNCCVEWQDEATARPVKLRVDDIALLARHLSNIAGSNQTSRLSLRWNTNGTAAIAASVQISPPTVDVALNITNVELHPLDPYLEPYVNAFLIDSKLGLEARVRMRQTTNELPEVTFQGDARLDDFATVDAQTDELLKWKSVLVTGLEAALQPPRVGIKEIAIVEPYARVALDTNQNLNLLAVLKTVATNSVASATQPAPVPADTAPGKKAGLRQRLGMLIRQALASSTNISGAPAFAIERVSLTNGLVQFNDRSVQPPVSSSVQELSGTITGISSEELKRADLHFTAKAARTGPIEITGKINPLNRNAPTQVAVLFRDVDLSPASPYAGKFLGYRLNRGRLGIQANYEVTQRHIQAKNVLMLDQFTLGEKVPSPDATHMPVKLAVALLKDRNGKIELELPIDGNLDDPNFHFGKVILHVLANVMTKIVTSPFAALGALFGGKGEEVSYQDFAPGSSQLQSANAAKLDSLINGLYERPGLELQIEGCFDPVADRDGLRKLKLERRFREQKWSVLRKSEQAGTSPDQLSLTPEEYAGFLQAAYDAELRSGQITNVNETAAPATTVHPGKPERAASTKEDKGATALLQRPALPPAVAVDEKERLLLDTISVSDAELAQLAAERAQAARQRILDTGKVEAARLFLADPAASATNAATRVYFHLQ